MDSLNFKKYHEHLDNLKSKITVKIICKIKLLDTSQGINKYLEFILKFFFDIFFIFICYIVQTLIFAYKDLSMFLREYYLNSIILGKNGVNFS